MISKLRAEEILYMPYALILEPAITKVSSPSSATEILHVLSLSEDLFTFMDVLQLEQKDFLSFSGSDDAKLKILLEAVAELGFEETFPCQQ